MPLTLITGTSTSGKSTVAKELAKRGYEAFDTEHDGVSAWYNKDTNERVAEFGQVPERTEAWFNQHEWRISIEWVTNTAKNAGDKQIFLCGGGANEVDVRVLCKNVIWLKTNEETIRKRVRNPRDHSYGTKPHELAAAIQDNLIKEQEYCAFGATIIDATRPIDEVVEAVIAATQE